MVFIFFLFWRIESASPFRSIPLLPLTEKSLKRLAMPVGFNSSRHILSWTLCNQALSIPLTQTLSTSPGSSLWLNLQVISRPLSTAFNVFESLSPPRKAFPPSWLWAFHVLYCLFSLTSHSFSVSFSSFSSHPVPLDVRRPRAQNSCFPCMSTLSVLVIPPISALKYHPDVDSCQLYPSSLYFFSKPQVQLTKCLNIPI